MRIIKFFSFSFVLLALTVNSFAQEKYALDKAHSNIGFSVRHMLVAKVSGQFTDFSGTIMYDAQDITKSSVNVTIKAASINTENANRDKHLRSGDFFNTEVDSLITFVSKRIEKSDDGYVAIGDFTLRGVTREISLPFTIFGTVKDARGNTRLGLEARTSINRFDYGVKWDAKFDGTNLVASNEVEVNLTIAAVASKPL
jgi:polyisoprenoid-binding protein YceI